MLLTSSITPNPWEANATEAIRCLYLPRSLLPRQPCFGLPCPPVGLMCKATLLVQPGTGSRRFSSSFPAKCQGKARRSGRSMDGIRLRQRGLYTWGMEGKMGGYVQCYFWLQFFIPNYIRQAAKYCVRGYRERHPPPQYSINLYLDA